MSASIYTILAHFFFISMKDDNLKILIEFEQTPGNIFWKAIPWQPLFEKQTLLEMLTKIIGISIHTDQHHISLDGLVLSSIDTLKMSLLYRMLPKFSSLAIVHLRIFCSNSYSFMSSAVLPPNTSTVTPCPP
jgi:hypothetical protein